jgi:hypothetical protein
MNKNIKLYDIPTCYTKFLKYDPFWQQIEDICHDRLENNPIKVKVQGAPNAMDYCFTSTLGYYFELVWGEMWYKNITKLKA